MKLSLLSNAARISGWVLLASLLSSCDQKPEKPKTPVPQTVTGTAGDSANSLQQAWVHGAAAAETTKQQALVLQQTIHSLINEPTEITLGNARDQWHIAHQQLLHLAPLLTLGTTSPGLFKQLHDAQQTLDAWPIEPGYLDYFDVYQHSGIVNDIVIAITAPAIRSQHGFSSDADVTLGLHAMAYLLWGENGRRPASDFVTQAPTAQQRQNGLSGADLPPQRRASLLQLQATLLIDDLESLIYRLNHNASALNRAYFSLAPSSQRQLWQQSLLDILERDIIGAQLAPKLQAGTDIEEHSAYVGRPGQTLAASLKGIENLLLSSSQDQLPLAYWLLNPQPADKKRVDDFAVHLRQAQAIAIDYDEQWASLTNEQIEALLRAIEAIAAPLK